MSGKGQPPGFVGNPIGKNQYVSAAGEGERNAKIGFRVPSNLKERAKTAAKRQNKSLTEWIEEAMENYLDFEIVKDSLKIALKQKKNALSQELTQKSPNQSLIEEWKAEIEKLENIILS